MRWAKSFLFAGIALAACGSDAQKAVAPDGVCVPGKSEACVGPAGCSGGQVCNADGTGFGECLCSADDGTGGAGGAAPSSGGKASRGGASDTGGVTSVSTGGAVASGGVAAGGDTGVNSCTPGTVWKDGCQCDTFGYVRGDKPCNALGTYDECFCAKSWLCRTDADKCDCRYDTPEALSAAGYTDTRCPFTMCCVFSLSSLKCECADVSGPGDGGDRCATLQAPYQSNGTFTSNQCVF